MANFTDRLKVIVDWDGKSAETGLGRFRDAVRSADTTTGKFKAGASAAFTSLQANAGSLAVAGGAALLTFGLKAANAFSDSAKAAIDLGNATGFSTEEASRWIAVGDDFEVSADAIGTAVGRIAKDLDAKKWAEYGIATRDASGQARSANDIFLDVMDVLAKIPNETERARVAAQLLGKGWQSISPMIGKTRSEYEDMLGSVSDGQVITEGEAKRAEEWRLAQDELNDALQDATVAIGDVVVSLAPLIEKIAQVVSTAEKLGLIETAARGSIPAFEGYGDAAAWAAENTKALESAVSDVSERMGFQREATEKVTFELGRADRRHQDVASSAQDAAKAIDDQTEAADALYESIIDLADAHMSLLDAQDRADDALKDYVETLGDGESTLEDVDDAARDTAGAFIDLAKKQADAQGQSEDTAEGQAIMRDELQKVADTLAPGSPLRLYLEGYIAQLDRIPKNKNTQVTINGVAVGIGGGGVPMTLQPGLKFHDGGVVPGPPGAEVPAILKAGETVLPTHKSGAASGLGGSTTIYIDARGMDPDEMVRALQEHLRRNGGSL